MCFSPARLKVNVHCRAEFSYVIGRKGQSQRAACIRRDAAAAFIGLAEVRRPCTEQIDLEIADRGGCGICECQSLQHS